MTSEIRLDDAEVTLKSRVEGKDITITGNVQGIVAVEEDVYDFGYSDRLALSRHTDYTLRLLPKDDVAFTFKVKKNTVNRTARIEAADRTAAAFEQARKAVGAPKKAKMRIGDWQRMDGSLLVEDVDSPNPIMVEFYWKDEV